VKLLSRVRCDASKNEIHRPWYKRQQIAPFWRMDVRKRLAVNMKRLRKERGWSQEALADEAGLDRTYISGIERVVKNPTITVVERLARALGCPLGALLD
jgi:DNA-binding XRE family transcriptional regulator